MMTSQKGKKILCPSGFSFFQVFPFFFGGVVLFLFVDGGEIFIVAGQPTPPNVHPSEIWVQ